MAPATESGFRRTLLVADAVPGPRPGLGTTVLLARLLAGFPRDSLSAYVPPTGLVEFGSRQEAQESWSVEVAAWPRPWKDSGRGWVRLGIWSIPLQSSRLIRLIRSSGIERVLALSTSPEMFIPAYLAARRTGCPLTFYLIDYWHRPEGRGGRFRRWLSDRYVRKIAADAERIWALSPEMAHKFSDEFGREAEVLPHCIDVPDEPPAPRLRTDDSPFVIGLVGTLYWLNLDSFRNLLSAVEDLRASGIDARVRHITRQSPESRAVEGVPAADFLDTAPAPDVLQALAEVDVVFFPMTFDPAARQTVEVAFSTRVIEYLASGRPIVANTPGYSEVSKYLREHDCGLVVDSPDPATLAEVLRGLAADPELCSRLAAKAFEVARSNHDSREVVSRFLDGFRA